ncbi:hypothetical protein F4X73_05250 [Candidatus Poribacteria bacterium]|nr:hypothetical protein [Candidatus Poribacteria bacterium]MYF55071.1 hypothetical protein [Candidatus Poribacteria bacterium]
MKNVVFISLLIFCFFITHISFGAVTSIGEINVDGETKGIVPASSTVTLLVTLVIDRSQAVTGEEIMIIEITMPPGFQTEVPDFKHILRDRGELGAKVETSGGSVLRVVLNEPIIDFQNSIYEIAFDCRTPNNVGEKTFRARLRNTEDSPIGEYIRAGPADGKPNNDNFTLQVIPNVPPAPVTGFTATSDTTGENNVTLRWEKSTDLDVNGYVIYRDDDVQIDVEQRESTTFLDVNVPSGNHTYQITAFKTKILQSERSPIQTVNVSEDTAPPKPPNAIRIVVSGEGIVVYWEPSVSRDVSKYRIMFGSADSETLNPLPNNEISAEKTSNGTSANTSIELRFVDNRQLSTGSFTYAIVAIDEAENESAPAQKRLRIFDKPYPNPFTPLSPDPDFNTIVFPARTIDDAEGEFSVLLYNLNGVLIKSLIAELGETELKWDGKNENGEIVESGIYIYQLQIGESFKTGTIILAK